MEAVSSSQVFGARAAAKGVSPFSGKQTLTSIDSLNQYRSSTNNFFSVKNQELYETAKAMRQRAFEDFSIQAKN